MRRMFSIASGSVTPLRKELQRSAQEREQERATDVAWLFLFELDRLHPDASREVDDRLRGPRGGSR